MDRRIWLDFQIDVEIRISNVESYIKTTTRMLQAQLEATERNVKVEFSSLKDEVKKKFEEKSVEIASRLETMDEKNEFLKKALGQLESKDWLSKEDVTRYCEELRSKTGDFGHSELSLDEIKELAKQIVEKDIGKHAADGLGRVDHVLATAAAMAVKHSEPFSVGRVGNWLLGIRSDAEKIPNDQPHMD